jgi:hypothetical protein
MPLAARVLRGERPVDDRNAAVATAASSDAFGKLRFTRYGFPCRSTALAAPYTAPWTIAMNTPAEGGDDTVAGCVGASTVLAAISFHFVTSLACATVGKTSATSAATAARPSRAVFIAALSPLTPRSPSIP